MRQSVFKFIVSYLLFVVVFALQKPLFMLFHNDVYSAVTIADYLNVIYNGLPLDLSMAGYLSAIPGLTLIASQWVSRQSIMRKIEKIYYIVIATVIAMVMCLDVVLYGYWGFRLDMTPLFYFTTSPAAAMASVPFYYFIIGLVAMAVVSCAIAWLFIRVVASRTVAVDSAKGKKIRNTAILTFLTAMLFIPIRGGFTVSTMNLSAVYFSQNQQLNHAAINPLFSLMYSATHQNDFASQFRYFEANEADEIFAQLYPSVNSDSTKIIISDRRPDVYVIILESFSSHLLNTGITPRLDSLASQGVFFPNIYASGIRTDRGIPAILSGYPAQPNTSIMKYVDKTDNLPSIARSLKSNGWETSYYYGGDANFTNMHAYLVSSGFEKIVSDKDFPISERLSKWGAHDHLVFDRCIDDVTNCNSTAPQLRVIQTSSSHEPFEVPFQKLENPRANAFAYTDSCVGNFIDSLRVNGNWAKSLIILVPDHYGAYPQNLTKQADKHHIPLVFTGGAVTNPIRVEVVGSQIDIAATLLAQLGLSYEEFTFSKNLLNTQSQQFAFIAAPSLWGLIAPDRQVIYDYDADKLIESQGSNQGQLTAQGKAFIQKLYDDLDKR